MEKRLPNQPNRVQPMQEYQHKKQHQGTTLPIVS